MIHPTAIVESGAQLGADVKIGPYAFVGAKARLGDGCVLAPHAVVLDYATLGARCRVQAPSRSRSSSHARAETRGEQDAGARLRPEDAHARR